MAALCKLVNETLEANMNYLLSVSEESEEGCQEALDGIQLLQVRRGEVWGKEGTSGERGEEGGEREGRKGEV